MCRDILLIENNTLQYQIWTETKPFWLCKYIRFAYKQKHFSKHTIGKKISTLRFVRSNNIWYYWSQVAVVMSLVKLLIALYSWNCRLASLLLSSLCQKEQIYYTQWLSHAKSITSEPIWTLDEYFLKIGLHTFDTIWTAALLIIFCRFNLKIANHTPQSTCTSSISGIDGKIVVCEVNTKYMNVIGTVC